MSTSSTTRTNALLTTGIFYTGYFIVQKLGCFPSRWCVQTQYIGGCIATISQLADERFSHPNKKKSFVRRHIVPVLTLCGTNLFFKQPWILSVLSPSLFLISKKCADAAIPLLCRTGTQSSTKSGTFSTTSHIPPPPPLYRPNSQKRGSSVDHSEGANNTTGHTIIGSPMESPNCTIQDKIPRCIFQYIQLRDKFLQPILLQPDLALSHMQPSPNPLITIFKRIKLQSDECFFKHEGSIKEYLKQPCPWFTRGPMQNAIVIRWIPAHNISWRSSSTKWWKARVKCDNQKLKNYWVRIVPLFYTIAPSSFHKHSLENLLADINVDFERPYNQSFYTPITFIEIMMFLDTIIAHTSGRSYIARLADLTKPPSDPEPLKSLYIWPANTDCTDGKILLLQLCLEEWGGKPNSWDTKSDTSPAPALLSEENLSLDELKQTKRPIVIMVGCRDRSMCDNKGSSVVSYPTLLSTQHTLDENKRKKEDYAQMLTIQALQTRYPISEQHLKRVQVHNLFIGQVRAHSTLIESLKNEGQELLDLLNIDIMLADVLEKTVCSWGRRDPGTPSPTLSQCVLIKRIDPQSDSKISLSLETKMHKSYYQHLLDKQVKPYWLVCPFLGFKIKIPALNKDNQSEIVNDLQMICRLGPDYHTALLTIRDVHTAFLTFFHSDYSAFIKLKEQYPYIDILCAPHLKKDTTDYYPVLHLDLEQWSSKKKGICTLLTLNDLHVRSQHSICPLWIMWGNHVPMDL